MHGLRLALQIEKILREGKIDEVIFGCNLYDY